MTKARRRILFCGAGFCGSGVSKSFPHIAKTLERAGYEVKVLVPHAADAGHLDIPSEYEVGPAFRWKVKGIWAGRALRMFHLLTGGVFRFALARRIPHDAFVVYAADCCIEWCRYSRKPVWAFLHLSPSTGPLDVLRPWIARDMRRSAALCRGVFAVSEAMRAAWRTIGIESEVLRLARPRIRLDVVPESGRDYSRCVFVGRLVEQKRPDWILEAIARVGGLSLTFVGDGPMRGALERMAEAPGLRGRVSFAGWQDDPMRFAVRAGLFVNASEDEGLCLAVLEALEAGVPVLATDIPANREALSDGRYGRLVSDSVDGLVDGLAAYAADRHACDPTVGFDAVRRELVEYSSASEERLAQTDWTGTSS